MTSLYAIVLDPDNNLVTDSNYCYNSEHKLLTPCLKTSADELRNKDLT